MTMLRHATVLVDITLHMIRDTTAYIGSTASLHTCTVRSHRANGTRARYVLRPRVRTVTADSATDYR